MAISAESTGEKDAVTTNVSHQGQPEVVGEMITDTVANNGNVIDDGLQRGLKSRHLQMIAFGGVVG